MDITQDVRYAIVSDAGREELKVYLEWINQNQLSDSESSYIYFAIGRGGLKDARHLFAIWQKICESIEIDTITKLHTMRFFLNPTESSFALESAAGWFDFLPQVYELATTVDAPDKPSTPQFVKMSDENVAALDGVSFNVSEPHHSTSSVVTNEDVSLPEVTIRGWGIGVMHFTISRAQLAQAKKSYDENGAAGTLTYLFSQCPQDRMIQYFMGFDEGLAILDCQLKDIARSYAFKDIDFAENIDNRTKNAGGAEFYCLLYSPDMIGKFNLPKGELFDPQQLKLNIARYSVAENLYAVALEGDLVHSIMYQGQPVALHCTPNDYSYYGQLYAYQTNSSRAPANISVFRSNTEIGQWELSHDTLVKILSS